MLHRRHFTLAQAGELLPAVGRILHGVRTARRYLGHVGQGSDLALRAETSGGAWPGREHAEATLVVTLGFERLEELDVIVRDLDRGIVDFPTLIDGREAYLCWRAGETAIMHWHELDSGFAGRRPLGREAGRS
jgi:hypothetical protein